MGTELRVEPMDLPIIKEIPDVFTFMDGRKVTSKEDWSDRLAEIKDLYEYYMYGPLPDTSAEKVSYTIGEWQDIDEDVKQFDGSSIHAKARVGKITVTVECEGRKDSFPALVTLPCEEAGEGGYPVYIEMSFVFGPFEFKPSGNAYLAAKRGYATLSFEPVKIAADNSSRTGVFYTLHPYGSDWKEQTGALAAWGWGAAKLLDMLEQGAGEELHINSKNNILSGVSRFGKAVLVAGAYEKRFKVVVPACSGAGGAAMYRCKTEGNMYDLAPLGFVNEEGGTTHVTTQNEHLGSLQSKDEGHWFNDTFLKFDCVERFPFDQHHLASLVADKDRYLFIIAAAFGEDWTNPAAMHKTYVETAKVYEYLGIPDNICVNIHKQGHAVLLSDMEKILDYCDVMLYGRNSEDVETDLQSLKQKEYFLQVK